MNLRRTTESEKGKRKFHSCHKSSVAWYICEGTRDSGTKFILIDETLLKREGDERKKFPSFCLPAKVDNKKKLRTRFMPF